MSNRKIVLKAPHLTRGRKDRHTRKLAQAQMRKRSRMTILEQVRWALGVVGTTNPRGQWHMLVMLTEDGVAAPETAICTDCAQDPHRRQHAQAQARTDVQVNLGWVLADEAYDKRRMWCIFRDATDRSCWREWIP